MCALEFHSRGAERRIEGVHPMLMTKLEDSPEKKWCRLVFAQRQELI